MSRGLRLQDLAFLGRVGNSGVTPASFPGLYRWYKADEYSPYATSGDSVGGGGATWGPWTDQTGSGDNGIGLGTFRTDIPAAVPCLDMATTSFTFAPGALNDFTVVYVGICPGANDSFQFVNGGNAHQLRVQYLGLHAIAFYAGGAVITSDGLGATDLLEVLVTRRVGGVITFYQNKIPRNGGVDANPWTVVTMGSSGGGGTFEQFAEIMIYNVGVSDANLDLLYDQYLKPKWPTLP